jgi:hypothetical protein
MPNKSGQMLSENVESFNAITYPILNGYLNSQQVRNITQPQERED